MAPDRSILFVITTLAIGGAESVVRDLALRLVDRGWRVGVVSLVPASAHDQRLREAGVSVSDCGMTLGAPDPRGLFRLDRAISRFAPQIVHSHLFHATLASRLLHTWREFRLVSTSHNVYEGRRIRTLAYRITDRLTDEMTSVTEAAARSLTEAGGARKLPRVVPNGCDTDRFRPDRGVREIVRAELGVEDERFLWLSISNLTEQKDLHMAIDAAATLNSDGMALVIAGDGPEYGSLAARISSRGLTNVMLLGSRADPERLLAAADATLMTSRWEGLPMALIESAASGVPMVSTDVGGCSEVVIDGVTGYLTGSSRDEVVKGMRRMMSTDRESRSVMAASARALALRRFDIDEVTSRWEQIYLTT